MYSRISTYERQPLLLVNEDFADQPLDPDVGTNTRMFNFADPGWLSTESVGGGLQALLDITFHRGVCQFSTPTADNSSVTFGWAGQGSNLTTPNCVVSADQVYQWDWWWNMSSVASVDLLLGLRDSWTGTVNNQIVMQVDTDTNANIHIVTTSGGSTTDTDTGVAATTGWHRWTARRANRLDNQWEFFQNGVQLGLITTNISVAPVTIGGRIRTRTTASKTLLVDHCQLWSDGEDLIFS